MPRDQNAQQTLLKLADALETSVLAAEQVIHHRTYPEGPTTQQIATEIRRLINLDHSDCETASASNADINESDFQHILFTLNSSHDDDWPGPTDDDIRQIVNILVFSQT